MAVLRRYRAEMHTRYPCLAFVAVVTFSLSGCATKPPVEAPEPPLDSASAARTVVFPALDIRPAGAPNASVERCETAEERGYFGLGRDFFTWLLRRRNSLLEWPVAADASPGVQAADLENEVSEKLRGARRGEAGYAVFTVVRKFQVVGTSLDSEVRAYLVDTSTGRIVWQAAGEDSKWLGVVAGPMYMLAPGTLPPAVVCAAFGRAAGRAFGGMPQLTRAPLVAQ